MKLNWQIRFMFSVWEWYTRDDNVKKIVSESFASNISPATMPVRGECCMVYWGGGVICTLMSKSYMNYHFPQCIVKPQSGMVIWTVNILKEILDIFTFSEFCKHITSIYIFRIFTKWAFPDYFVFHAPLYSVIQWLYIEALWTVKLQCLKVTKIWFQCLLGNKWRNVLSIVTIAIWEID